MTTRAPSPAVRAERGFRIERIPGRPLRALEDGRIAVPLWIVKDGKHAGDTEMVMSIAEAEQLHASLCYALDGQPVPSGAPDCRKTVQKGPSA